MFQNPCKRSGPPAGLGEQREGVAARFGSEHIGEVGKEGALRPAGDRNRIGNRVRIHSGCFVEMVTTEDDVSIGPNVVFTDDPHPVNCPRYRGCKSGPVVRRLARIGANSTVLPGVKIGVGALVGAGSVATNNVPAGTVVVGNPARVMKHVDELTCPPGWFDRPYV